jgi:hypothetical protein
MIRIRVLILAALIVFLLPAWIIAETVTFRNDCRVSVVVQTATVQRGVLKRDQCLLRAGESTTKMPLDSDKVITVFDGKTGRTLFRDALKKSKTPLYYSIAPDPRNPSRIRMMPTKPTTMPKDRSSSPMP